MWLKTTAPLETACVRSFVFLWQSHHVVLDLLAL